MNSTRRRHIIPISLMLFTAFSARALWLDQQSFWYDEAFSVWLAAKSFGDITWHMLAVDSNTPAHYWLLKAWLAMAGGSDFSARLLSVFGGVTAAALATLLPSRTARVPAVICCGAIALWPALVQIGQDARTYAWMGAAVVASTAALSRALTRNARKAWWTWALFTVLTVGMHIMGIGVFVAQLMVAAGWLWKSDRARRSARIAASIIPVAACAVMVFGMLLLLRTLSSRLSVSAGAPISLADADVALSRGLAAYILPKGRPEALLPAAAIACCGLLGYGLWRGHRFAAAIVIVFTIVFSLMGLLTNVYAPRYYAVAMPLMLVAATPRAAASFGRLKWGLLPAGLACLAGLLALRRDPLYANDDFRGVMRFLDEQAAADEPVLALDGNIAIAMDHYARAVRTVAVVPKQGYGSIDYEGIAPLLNRALSAKRGVWLVTWIPEATDPTDVTRRLLARQAMHGAPMPDMPRFAGIGLSYYRFPEGYRPTPDLSRSALVSRQLPAGQDTGRDIGLRSAGCVHAGGAARQLEIWCFWLPGAQQWLPVNAQVSIRVHASDGRRVAQYDGPLLRSEPARGYALPIFADYRIELAQELSGDVELEIVPYLPGDELRPRQYLRVTIDPN